MKVKKSRWFFVYCCVLLPFLAGGAALLGFITVYNLCRGAYTHLNAYFATPYDRSSFYMAVGIQIALYLSVLAVAIVLTVRLPKGGKTIGRINTGFLFLTAATVAFEIAVNCWFLVSPLLVFLAVMAVLCGAWVLPNGLYFHKCHSVAASSVFVPPQITVTDTGVPVDLSAEETPLPDKAEDSVCTHCGCELVAGASFCYECGWKVSVALNMCGRCGAELLEGAKFCRMCGEKTER